MDPRILSPSGSIIQAEPMFMCHIIFSSEGVWQIQGASLEALYGGIQSHDLCETLSPVDSIASHERHITLQSLPTYYRRGCIKMVPMTATWHHFLVFQAIRAFYQELHTLSLGAFYHHV